MRVRYLQTASSDYIHRLLVASLVIASLWTQCASARDDRGANGHYTQRVESRDGIGKFYMGREIARIVGHQAARWLERSARASEEKPDEVVAKLGLKPDDIVADVGAGSGYFTFRLSREVPQGKVLAVDIQVEMLRMIQRRATLQAVDNVQTILSTIDDPKLPKSTVDVVLMVDAYHEFSHPREMMLGIVAGLKPDGRVVLIEYRGEDPTIPIKPLHKMTEQQVIREMEAVGLQWRETQSFLPQQHFMVFEKPD